MKKNALAALTVLLILAAVMISCSPVGRQPSPAANHEAALRNPPVELYPAPATRTEGSLFTDDSQVELFGDVKANRVGDIITINIVETSKASKNAQTQLDRDNSLSAGITALLGFEQNLNELPFMAYTKLPETARSDALLGATFQNKFKGTGKTSRNETMTAQISARVIQVLPNGDLVIRGSREITVNNEKQYIIIQGVVRPQDISPDNTIQSSYIADAKIDYTGEGDISRQQRKGWLNRLVDVVWPF
jgi:flagellar L-ring protein precursor FlgH